MERELFLYVKSQLPEFRCNALTFSLFPPAIVGCSDHPGEFMHEFPVQLTNSQCSK